MANRICFVLIAFAISFAIPQSLSGHEIFQDVLKEQYMLKSFSCKTCHATKDRKIRTKFADRIYQKLKSQDFTTKFAKAVEDDKAAKAKDPGSVGKAKGAVHDFEQAVAVEFKKAFAEVAKESMTFDELIKSGLLAGARLDKKKIEAAKAKQMEKQKAGAKEPASDSKKADSKDGGTSDVSTRQSESRSTTSLTNKVAVGNDSNHSLLFGRIWRVVADRLWM